MGKKSVVDKLPEALRIKLIELLHNPAITQVEIADAINESAGKPLISKSSVNRYAIRMRKFAEKTGKRGKSRMRISKNTAARSVTK